MLIYYADQCDKKKCTSIKINDSKDKLSFKVIWTQKSNAIRQNSIVLTPNTSTFLTKSDKTIVDRFGITILDCSWKQGQKYLNDWSFLNGRKLPPLIAGNPVNYGKWEKLTSLEALASSFYIIGLDSLSNELLGLYNWGKTFLDLNQELLNVYRECSTQEDVVNAYNSFFSLK